MPLRIICLFALMAIAGSCSRDDGPPIEEALQLPDFLAIGEDTEQVFQMSFEGNGKTVAFSSLTEKINLSNRYLTHRQIGTLLTFFYFRAGAFGVIQHDMLSGESRELGEVFRLDGDQSVIWGTNTEDAIIMGYYAPIGSGNYQIRKINIESRDESELTIAFNANNVFDPLYHNGHLFLTYVDSNGEYRVSIVETETFTILQAMEFGQAVPTLAITGDEQLAIITGGNINSYILSVYEPAAFTLLWSQAFQVDRFFDPGPLDARLEDEILYYIHYFPQPSTSLFGPAFYDFSTGMGSILDMNGIHSRMETELGENIELTAVRYFPQKATFGVGFYYDSGDTGIQGGIMMISRNGQLLETVSVPFAPTYILR